MRRWSYAALFWALRLDCAGVKPSLSSLLLLLLMGSSVYSASSSPIEAIGGSVACCAAGEADVADVWVNPVLCPMEVSNAVKSYWQ